MDKKLASVLDQCLEALRQGEDLETVLARHPQEARELEPLLRTALEVQQALAYLRPLPGARDRVWTHLQPSLRPAPQRRRFPVLAWSRPWSVALASLVLALFLAGGSVLASSQSLPGQPLYPVKLATEQVQVAFTPTRVGKARLELRLAERRSQEMVALAGRDGPQALDRLAQRLDRHLERAVGAPLGLSPALAPSIPSPAPLQPPAHPFRGPAAAPQDQTPQPPGLEKSREGEGQALEPEGEKPELEKRLEAGLRRQRALLEALDRVPPEARPHLRRALERNLENYQKALERLREKRPRPPE